LPISEADVKYVADLANLELTAEEVAALQRDLSAILDYVKQLNSIDTRNVEPMAQVLGQPVEAALAAALRPDRAVPCLGSERALANAPESGAGYFKVPRIIGAP
jgi:aspartyl-tRNA(Asn)/glutamyl-tRNA(Gln) amidotransferase subunit C